MLFGVYAGIIFKRHFQIMNVAVFKETFLWDMYGLRLDVEHPNPLRDCGGKRRKARIPVMLQLGLKGDRMVIGHIIFSNIQFGTLVMYTICIQKTSKKTYQAGCFHYVDLLPTRRFPWIPSLFRLRSVLIHLVA